MCFDDNPDQPKFLHQASMNYLLQHSTIDPQGDRNSDTLIWVNTTLICNLFKKIMTGAPWNMI